MSSYRCKSCDSKSCEHSLVFGAYGWLISNQRAIFACFHSIANHKEVLWCFVMGVETRKIDAGVGEAICAFDF